MQFKPVPEPPASLARLERVRMALPPEPDPSADCCGRVIERTAIETRESAAAWITFCRALGLAVAEPDGYRREPLDGGLEPARLGQAFRERIVGVEDVLCVLESVSTLATAEAVSQTLAESDVSADAGRRGHGDGRSNGTDRVYRILEWAALFELVERGADGYRPA